MAFINVWNIPRPNCSIKISLDIFEIIFTMQNGKMRDMQRHMLLWENIHVCIKFIHDNGSLSLKCKISAIWLVETAWIFLIFLIATKQISMECETHESEVGYTHIWIYTNAKHKYVGIG